VTSHAFLQHLGLNSIAQLPTLEVSEDPTEHDEMLKG
jgi:chromosome segregation and condensation protein ScpB